MRFHLKFWVGIFGILALPFSCTEKSTETTRTGQGFTSLEASSVGIDFINQLDFNEDFNIYTYRNFYNGGGVGMGDVNNDGLMDLYFTGNMKGNRLYINKGDWKFEDVTEKAGVKGTRAWSTGVTMADVNGDGWMDIYVCNSGDLEGDNKQNELFINQKDGTFKDLAEAYGLADQGYSTHAAFFDYDRDGDLDMYLLNNSYQAIGSFNLRKNMRPQRDKEGGDKLFRNDPINGQPKYTDVSEQAGIYGSVIGFGLGITVGDINMDGWIDIFVSNDFFERDYIYINQQDGTFKETLESAMRSISGASMGADMADINNDGWPDIFVTEMLPETENRIKTSTTFENWNRYQYNLENGYYHQFTRNMLHLNNGDVRSEKTAPTFSEIGRLANVEATDWSWGALIFDMDNDGLRDIFVANGIYQDLTNQDFLNFLADDENKLKMITDKGVDYKKLISVIPSEPISNYAFKNGGDLGFTNMAKPWGMDKPSFSNGSAYGDLDNDGDLDLVVNNVNMAPFIYKNEATATHPENKHLRVSLSGNAPNTMAVGSKVYVCAGDKKWLTEALPMRGFESCVDPRMLFGLGNISKIDSVVVYWPDGQRTVETKVELGTDLKLKQPTESPVSTTTYLAFTPPFTGNTPFQEINNRPNWGQPHIENTFVDFDRDRLLFHMLSKDGPRLCFGDVNGDSRMDYYRGGAKDQPGAMMIQQADGNFNAAPTNVFAQDSMSEDTDCILVDLNGDKLLDLYVASGGNEYPNSSTSLADRLYFNKGNGRFEKSPQILPAGKLESTSTVRPYDIDGDGDMDLLVAARLRPFLYGVPANSYLLENDGKGNFRNISNGSAPALKEVGMVTDMAWVDVNGDKAIDMVLLREWDAPLILLQQNKKWVASSTPLTQTGWWNRIAVADIDNDGDMDFVAGNHGLNSRFRGDKAHPISMYINDFDQNSAVEQIICQFNGDNTYPMMLRHDLVSQMPHLKKKYLKYEAMKSQTLQDIFTPKELERTLEKKASELRTGVFLNDGKGNFTFQALPIEAQFSPVYAIALQDFDGDKQLDILLGGNFYGAKPEVGRYDASYGLLLKGNGKGQFQSIPSKRSGIFLDGETRDFAIFPWQGQQLLLVAKNDGPMQRYVWK